MIARRLLFVLLWSLIAGGACAGECVPAPNYHCVQIDGFAYVPNAMTVNEGDSVEFAASSFHPMRQVLRAFPSTTAVHDGYGCSEPPCIKEMDASVVDADGWPVFHYICVNHIKQVMRGDIFIVPRAIFAAGFE